MVSCSGEGDWGRGRSGRRCSRRPPVAGTGGDNRRGGRGRTHPTPPPRSPAARRGGAAGGTGGALVYRLGSRARQAFRGGPKRPPAWGAPCGGSPLRARAQRGTRCPFRGPGRGRGGADRANGQWGDPGKNGATGAFGGRGRFWWGGLRGSGSGAPEFLLCLGFARRKGAGPHGRVATEGPPAGGAGAGSAGRAPPPPLANADVWILWGGLRGPGSVTNSGHVRRRPGDEGGGVPNPNPGKRERVPTKRHAPGGALVALPKGSFEFSREVGSDQAKGGPHKPPNFGVPGRGAPSPKAEGGGGGSTKTGGHSGRGATQARADPDGPTSEWAWVPPRVQPPRGGGSRGPLGPRATGAPR